MNLKQRIFRNSSLEMASKPNVVLGRLWHGATGRAGSPLAKL